MRLSIVLFFVLLSVSLFAQTPSMPLPHQSPSQPRIMLEDGSIVGADNPMPVTGSFDIGSVSVDVPPAYVDKNGDPASAEVDDDKNVKVSINTEAIGLVDAINAQKRPVDEIQATVISLTANTSTQITSAITTNRRFIEVVAMDNTKDFWVNYNSPAVQGACRRVYGGIYLEIPASVVVNVLASEAIDLMVTEGGHQ